MAGSYKHIVNKDGSFAGTAPLDSMGDAYQALEECYCMIQQLTGGDKAKIHEAWLEGYFKKHCPFENLPLATYEEYWGEPKPVAAENANADLAAFNKITNKKKTEIPKKEVSIVSITVIPSFQSDGPDQLLGIGQDGTVYTYEYIMEGLELHYRWKPLRMSTEFGPEPQ